MSSNSSGAEICPQCGAAGGGNYCANCGASLKPGEESVSEEARSKLTSPLIAALSFVKAIWLMWVSPVVFLRSYLTGSPALSQLDFPLSSAWRVVDKAPQKVMGPFQCLTFAIALFAVLSSLERAVWSVSDIGHRLFGESITEMRDRFEEAQTSYYQQNFGRRPYLIDTAHLTGVGPIDHAIEEIVGLLGCAYFPLVAVLFLARGNVKRYQVMHCYLYAISAAMCGFAALDALGLLAFSAGASAASLYVMGLSGLGSAAGLLIIVYFVALMPIFVLPKVLDLPKSRVVLATCIAALAWLAGRFVVFMVFPQALGIVWT
jgi:hypothetical protein